MGSLRLGTISPRWSSPCCDRTASLLLSGSTRRGRLLYGTGGLTVPLCDWFFSTALTWLPWKPEERRRREGWESAFLSLTVAYLSLPLLCKMFNHMNSDKHTHQSVYWLVTYEMRKKKKSCFLRSNVQLPVATNS